MSLPDHVSPSAQWGRLWLELPDWIRRAVWTFLQTLAALLIATGTDHLDAASIKLAVIGALAAALSIAKSGAVAWLRALRDRRAGS